MIEQALGGLFGVISDVYVLRFLMFILLVCIFTLGIPYTPWGDKDKGNPRIAKFLVVLIAFIAAGGIPDNYIVGIFTGYSWAVIVSFVLLPVIGLLFILGMKGEGAGSTIAKIIAVGIILFAVSSFYEIIDRNNPELMYFGEAMGVTLRDIFSVVSFVLIVVLIYFIFDLLSSQLLGSNRIERRPRYRY